MEPAKLDWLRAHVRCPRCSHADLDLDLDADGLQCPGCGVVFGHRSRALDFLDSETSARYQLDETENVSTNGYDHNAMSIINQVGQTGGMVLDCGSGMKSVEFPHVVQLEIVDYPFVDVLGVNQHLPFVDDCFDAVLSLDVLEHVDQPFVSAAETARVLKPGGAVYVDIPFLQPEHGYPHHYFNASRQGLRQLFAGHLDVISHQVPESGLPIYMLHWVLNEYRSGLPDAARQRFESLTMGQLAGRELSGWLDDPIVTELSQEKRWVLACTTHALLRKPLRASTATSSVVIEPSSLPRFPEAPKPDIAEPCVTDSEPLLLADDQPSAYRRVRHLVGSKLPPRMKRGIVFLRTQGLAATVAKTRSHLYD